jgi:hypothetical protein
MLGWWGVNRAFGVRHELGWVDSERKTLPPWEPLPLPADNAADAYAAAIGLLPAGGEARAVSDWLTAVAQGDAAGAAELLPEVRDCVGKSAGALAKMHEAASKDYVSPAEPDVDQTKPWLRGYRSLAEVAAARAYLAHLDGDDRSALAAVEDGYALGVKTPRGGGLIEASAGANFVAIVQRRATEVLLSRTVPPRVLRAHAERVRRIRGEVWPFARIAHFEGAQSLLAADAVASGGMPAHHVHAPDDDGPHAPDISEISDLGNDWMLATGARKSREWLEDRYARYVEELAKPPGESRFRELAGRAEADARVRNDWLAELLMPHDLRDAFDKYARMLVHLEADETISCLEACKRERGAYPASLAELVPDYMPDVPQDPWTGKPLVYRLTPERYTLYAVGPNGVDDGGVTEGGGSMEPDLVIVPVPPPRQMTTSPLPGPGP